MANPSRMLVAPASVRVAHVLSNPKTRPGTTYEEVLRKLPYGIREETTAVMKYKNGSWYYEDTPMVKYRSVVDPRIWPNKICKNDIKR